MLMNKKSEEQGNISKMIPFCIIHNNLKIPNSCIDINTCVYKRKIIENINAIKRIRYIFTCKKV